MKSFDPGYLAKLVIPHSLVTTIRQIGEHKGRQLLFNQQAPEMLENLRRVAVIQSTESSNRLEGITADHKKIRELVEEKTTPANRSEAEIAGYRDVLNTIHTNYEHIPFTVNVVLQLHRDLMKYTEKEGGHWKSASNEIVEFLPDGTKRIRFVPVEPYRTAEYMSTLHKRYDEVARNLVLDPLILTPLYVLDFLCIHPFLDGNGRLARLLSVLLLYHNGYEVGRYISLERVVEQTRESYYDTLHRSSHGWHDGQHDALPWVEYFLSTLLAAYREFESRLGRLSSGHGSKTDMVLNAIDGFIGDFSISDVEKACPTVGRDWVRTLLQRLRQEGRIEALGKGRYARWRKIQ
ncbi:MAG: Adenosine monophosphate-protein transferase SoFic [Syntrophorhabdus sp. PtaU1.Bin050]|nr:MAG: Adenosine monophosphate-protein transferase SoFic [Syntrophorhabdus sp. PtaU1.Bin050]